MQHPITSLLLVALLALSLQVVAQTNTPLTREQRRAAMQKQLDEMNRQMQAATEAAQKRALERAARMATNPQPRFDTNPVVRISPPRQSYYNTNNHSPGIGDAIRDFEKLVPGYSTNFTPAQLALTNPHRNVIYRTNGSPELRSPPLR